MTILEWMSVVVFSIILALCYYLLQPLSTSRVVYVPAGSVKQIITYLKANDFSLCGIDHYLIRPFGQPQHGWIDMGKNRMLRGDFYYQLTHAKAAMVKITLIPGETRVVFLHELAAKLALDEALLNRYYECFAPYPDGVLLADTYHIPKGIGEEHLIRYLVGDSLARHKKLSIKFFGHDRMKKWFRFVTIASIIQKEAANNNEMPLVGSVIYNRLQKGMPLQMDGSLNYGGYSHKKVTKRRILEDESAFNTYKNKGLPPYPVCSVTLEALKAAISPATTDYLYFIRAKDGKHIFSKSYRQHLKAMKM